MPSHRPIKESILKLWSRTDVVNYLETVAIVGALIGYDSNMGELSSYHPGDEIPWLEVRGDVRYFKLLAETAKKYHQIWHSSMINVGISGAQSPQLGIEIKVLLHIFMN